MKISQTILIASLAPLIMAVNGAQAAQNESESLSTSSASTSTSSASASPSSASASPSSSNANTGSAGAETRAGADGEVQNNGVGAAAQTDLKEKIRHKSNRPAFYEDLDKIDDVNPYVIKSVIVEGNKLIQRSQIKAVIKTKAGDFYHRKEIAADLKAIYDLGYFEPGTFHVEAEKTAAGLVIRVHLKENPLLKKVTVSGNNIVPTEKIEELFKGQFLKPRCKTQISTALKSIDSTYKNQGYLLAHATTGKDDPEGTMPVIVDEGIVQEIKIVCPTDEQKQLVLEAISLKVGAPYNEKNLTSDLKAAFKTGKVDELQRQVDKDKNGGYIVTISAVQKSKPPKTKSADSGLLKGSKSKSALPVLNRLIKSPMYKDIK